MGTAGAPVPYQDGGDNERGVEQAGRDVGGEDPAVHAEPFSDVPVADLETKQHKDGVTGRGNAPMALLGDSPGAGLAGDAP